MIPLVTGLLAPLKRRLRWFRREDPHMGVSVSRRPLTSTLISSMSSESEEMMRSRFPFPDMIYVLLDVNSIGKYTTRDSSVANLFTCGFDMIG